VLVNSSYHAPDTGVSAPKKPRKNWEGITTDILSKEKEKTTDEDANVGGDASVNDFFRKIYDGADEDTKRAMLKSYQESGGTALSTNWGEVKKETVPVQPPTGSVWKKWGA
jgi:suppressor of G2 allele of SKP1